MTYTHRNGETDAPTVHGCYWFSGNVHGWTRSLLTETSSDCQMAYNDTPSVEAFECITGFVGQWWGPIVPPWESEVK